MGREKGQAGHQIDARFSEHLAKTEGRTGKAHPRDEGGKALIARLYAEIQRLRGAVPMAFLPGYDIALARKLVSGADAWLNTPQPPLEASGTSGMKAALNGVPSPSVLDGWWVEGCIEGITGWAIGAEGDAPESHGGTVRQAGGHRIAPRA